MRGKKFLLAVLMAGAAVTHGASAINLGDIDIDKIINIGKNVVKATESVPVEREMEIGRGMAASLLGAAPLLEDDGIQQYINRVGRWLASQTERSDLPWHFGVLNTESVNAFAAPGGYVFVTRGLLRVSNTESELAGVLAHEISHVLRRHHLEAIRKQAMREIAADLVGEAVKQQGFNAEPFIRQGMELYARGLDRDDEFESDLIGVVIATRAGYEPYGLPRTLRTLNGMNASDSNLKLLFSTHPPVNERLLRLDQQMTGKFESYSQQPQLAERYTQAVGQLQ
jgi:Putative Zn-dependent protease, contains TPR repeats